MWNWQKIEGIKNLPEFDRTVLLYQKKDGKKYAVIGWLKSIDGNGAHWSYGYSFDFFDVFKISMPKTEDSFIPTHWCDVEPPKDES